jgi:DNA replication and repair protein RecF
MLFNKVEIRNFRNLLSTHLTPSSSLNIIHGSNGSGKSSLLEALHYLATGSSFRTHRLTHILTHERECFTLFSQISSAGLQHRIGIKRCRDHTHQTRIDGSDVSKRSSLVQLVPLQVLSPETISLLVDGSENRRSFIDWALFHVEHPFHYHLSHYNRALKQRNALLKQNSHYDLEHWDAQLIEHGTVIDTLRSGYVEQIREPLMQIVASLLPSIDIDLSYRHGWASSYTLVDALLSSRESDFKLKHTTVGPHRGDMIVKSGGVKVSELLSRGQLKLLVIALKLAQLSLLGQHSSDTRPIILVDDLAAELDRDHRALLLETIKPLSSQLFITTPDLSLIDYGGWEERKVFHVEHGEVKEVV